MFRVLKNLSWLTQLGVSIVAPPLLCIWGGLWLRQRFGLGAWVMVVAIVLGLGASFSSAVGFYRIVRKQAEKDGNAGTSSFNHHE